jgi:NAD(P)-dependent dehydrogenase (short-subunit alcohol dehydrogenase family)
MSSPAFDITGQKVLIVGGGRGIGKGIALAFAEAGADVAVSALTPTGIAKVADEVQALGRKALALTGDATKAADMDRVAQQVLEGFGHLDTLVTCVGDSIRKPVVQLPGTSTPGMTEDEWRFIFSHSHQLLQHNPRSSVRLQEAQLPSKNRRGFSTMIWWMSWSEAPSSLRRGSTRRGMNV